MMADILFIWTKENADISYRQGMHELLALVIFVVEQDKLPLNSGAQTDEEYPPLPFFFLWTSNKCSFVLGQKSGD